VHENSFVPPPKVKSGVIRLQPKKQATDMKSTAAFFLLVKTAFQQRRKTMRNACRSLFTEETLKLPIFDKRAEQLTLEQFGQLTYQMK